MKEIRIIGTPATSAARSGFERSSPITGAYIPRISKNPLDIPRSRNGGMTVHPSEFTPSIPSLYKTEYSAQKTKPVQKKSVIPPISRELPRVGQYTDFIGGRRVHEAMVVPKKIQEQAPLQTEKQLIRRTKRVRFNRRKNEKVPIRHRAFTGEKPSVFPRHKIIFQRTQVPEVQKIQAPITMQKLVREPTIRKHVAHEYNQSYTQKKDPRILPFHRPKPEKFREALNTAVQSPEKQADVKHIREIRTILRRYPQERALARTVYTQYKEVQGYTNSKALQSIHEILKQKYQHVLSEQKMKPMQVIKKAHIQRPMVRNKYPTQDTGSAAVKHIIDERTRRRRENLYRKFAIRFTRRLQKRDLSGEEASRWFSQRFRNYKRYGSQLKSIQSGERYDGSLSLIVLAIRATSYIANSQLHTITSQLPPVTVAHYGSSATAQEISAVRSDIPLPSHGPIRPASPAFHS